MKLVKLPKMTSIPTMLVELQSIITHVIASTWFTGSAALTTAAQTALDDLSVAAATAADGTTADTQAMYVAAEELRIKMMAVIFMVDVVAINNVSDSAAIISAAGLQAKRVGSRNIATIAVKPGIEPGSGIVRVKGHNGYSYKIQMQKGTHVDPANWVDFTTATITRIPVSGLASLNQYWFRVALIKGITQGAFSSPVSISMP